MKPIRNDRYITIMSAYREDRRKRDRLKQDRWLSVKRLLMDVVILAGIIVVLVILWVTR